MSLIAHYTLDGTEASTTVTATVGTNGTLSGAGNCSASQVTGPGNTITHGMTFDGTNDRITITEIYKDTSTAYSLSVWYRAINTDYKAFFGQGADWVTAMYISAGGDAIFKTASNTATFTIPAIGTTWHHYLFTHAAGNTSRMFLDGTESSSGALTSAGYFSGSLISGWNSESSGNGELAQWKFFDSDESANAATLYAEGVGAASTGSHRVIGGWGGRIISG
jgi:hypothetical protein